VHHQHSVSLRYQSWGGAQFVYANSSLQTLSLIITDTSTRILKSLMSRDFETPTMSNSVDLLHTIVRDPPPPPPCVRCRLTAGSATAAATAVELPARSSDCCRDVTNTAGVVDRRAYDAENASNDNTCRGRGCCDDGLVEDSRCGISSRRVDRMFMTVSLPRTAQVGCHGEMLELRRQSDDSRITRLHEHDHR